jgi:endonuclease YncB( thermonuclease family)
MKSRYKRLTPLLLGVSLCLPLGLKLGIPLVLEQGERLGLFESLPGNRSSKDLYTVDRVQGLVITLHQPNRPSIQIQLAGLMVPNERWKDEATGILSMLVQASQNQVTVSFTEARVSDSPANALVQLPTGTYVQQILLSEGVAWLDLASVKRLPPEIVQILHNAEASAREEHKNIWSQR